MHSCIRPHSFIALRLPSGLFKVVEIVPNTIISIGKFGSFAANQLLGRPYNLTFDILDSEDGRETTELRLVPAAELHAETTASEKAAETENAVEDVVDGSENANVGDGGVQFDIVGEDGAVLMRNNRLTVDDASRQALSMEEIEALKKATTGSGKEIIAKIMASHQALDEKTAFSLAKYTLRKSRKYLKRFTVLPMDVGMLTEVMADKEHHRIMEAREEILGLVNAWGNVHYGAAGPDNESNMEGAGVGSGRWLVVDETGGLIVAAMAEKMGILYPPEEEDEESSEEEEEPVEQPNTDTDMKDAPAVPSEPQANADAPANAPPNPTAQPDKTQEFSKPIRRSNHNTTPAQSALSNTITLLHSNAQPNLGLLKYFSYDASSTADTISTHPLHTHLKTISWLQLLDPDSDTGYHEPEAVSEDLLRTWKSSKRGSYYRKRRRWERVKRVVDETQKGGFDGLVVASAMDPVGILKHCVPLLRGGGNVVVYSPTIEPLTEVMDLYSRDRRSAFMAATQETRPEDVSEQDFPVNPTLLLAPMLQTSRVRSWQVLPMRTHPVMTSRGGAEGFVFSATRVLPVEGRVEARGKFGKKRRAEKKAEAAGGNLDEKGGEEKQQEAIADGETESKRQKVVEVAAA